MTKSHMSHQFSQVPKATIPRSSFDRSHGLKTTFNSGLLIPIFLDEALPGDTFNLQMTGFSRISTLVQVPMDSVFMETFFFAVPYRLLWDNWKRFNGEQDNPDDSTDYLMPVLDGPQEVETGTLADYFGIPIGVNMQQLSPQSLPFRAYNLIYNEWFRDQNLQESRNLNKGDGPETYQPNVQHSLARRGKRHDYFTSALPWPQKGEPVQLPLGERADIRGLGINDAGTSSNPPPVRMGDGTIENWVVGMNGDDIWIDQGSNADNFPELYADLSSATAATINQLRQAFQVQKMLERDARGGTRYTELIRSHFGVTSPDARQQRPEFLGGGSSPLAITSVPQTSKTDASGPDESPQANLASYGTVTLRNHGFTKSFTEHSVIIGLVNVRADLTYQQGLNRMWSRQTRYDFYWPALAHIGEQAILSKEIYADGSAGDETVFGYQERFAEYRYKPSQITGKFRSSDPETLDSWHLAQEFAERPLLNAAFIEDNPPIERIVAVTDEPQFLFDAYFKLRCARPMPLYGVPGMIDHF